MALYGILKSSANTGAEDEILAAFVTPLSVISNQPISSSDTLSLKRLSAMPTSQRWEIETKLMPTNEMVDIAAHMIKNGKHNTIYIRMPQPYSAKEYESGVKSLVAGVTKGSATFSVTAGTDIRIGEFVQLRSTGAPTSAKNKVYMVTSVTVSGGNKVCTTLPNINYTHSTLPEVVIGNKVTMAAYYDTDNVMGVKYTDGILMDVGTVKIIEAL